MAKSNIDPALMGEYRKLAKRADQRLVRLEKLAESGDTNFEGVLTYSYKRAASDAAKWGSNADKPRFNIKPPETAGEIKAKIKDIEAFLEAPTSTKQGIINIYKKRADTFNDKFGEKDDEGNVKNPIKWQDLAKYYKSDTAKREAKRYGSRTIARAVSIKSAYISGKSQKEIQELTEAVKLAKAKKETYEFIEEAKASDKTINQVIMDIVAGDKIEKKTPAKKSYMADAINGVKNPKSAFKKDLKQVQKQISKANKQRVKARNKKKRAKARAKKKKANNRKWRRKW